MRCTSKRVQTVKTLAACLLSVTLLAGCAFGTEVENAYEADRPGLGVQTADERTEVDYFAKDLCVVDENVENVQADTEASLAVCFFNLDTKDILYAKNVHDRLYPASTTKIMTALVALKHGDLSAQATVSEAAVTFHESGVSTAKLKAGDRLTLEQLLYALLLPSANDAANVIAELVGGSIEQFVRMMNEEAASIGATNTHFVNPNGLHDEDHYTTAYDMYLMFQEALKYDIFQTVLSVPSYETTYLSADGKTVEASWKSSDLFTRGEMEVPEGVTALGGKTGTTTAAMSCLVQLFADDVGERYAAIIMGCKERALLYQEMQALIDNLNK